MLPRYGAMGERVGGVAWAGGAYPAIAPCPCIDVVPVMGTVISVGTSVT